VALSQKFIGIVVEYLGVNSDKVVHEASAKDNLGADSLDLVELIMALEEAYGIEIEDEETEYLKNIGELHALVERKAAAKGAPA